MSESFSVGVMRARPPTSLMNLKVACVTSTQWKKLWYGTCRYLLRTCATHHYLLPVTPWGYIHNKFTLNIPLQQPLAAIACYNEGCWTESRPPRSMHVHPAHGIVHRI